MQSIFFLLSNYQCSTNTIAFAPIIEISDNVRERDNPGSKRFVQYTLREFMRNCVSLFDNSLQISFNSYNSL